MNDKIMVVGVGLPTKQREGGENVGGDGVSHGYNP